MHYSWLFSSGFPCIFKRRELLVFSDVSINFFVVVAGCLMALYAVGWFVYKALVELSNHRLLGIVHFFQVMAAAAVLEVVAGHCVDNAFSVTLRLSIHFSGVE